MFLKISQNSQESTCAKVSFLIKLQGNFIKKETLPQVFSCKFCEISKNIFCCRTSPVVASVVVLSWLWNHVQCWQQKNKVSFVGSLHGGVAGGSGEASISGGFWVVFNGFCWLRVLLDGFRWFAVLVVTRISQHIEELFLYFTHKRTSLNEVIRFFYSK